MGYKFLLGSERDTQIKGTKNAAVGLSTRLPVDTEDSSQPQIEQSLSLLFAHRFVWNWHFNTLLRTDVS